MAGNEFGVYCGFWLTLNLLVYLIYTVHIYITIKTAAMTNYRILTAEGKVKFTGSEIGSWFSLEQARKLVDYFNGEMIYDICKGNTRSNCMA
jgi:hypothetical protein